MRSWRIGVARLPYTAILLCKVPDPQHYGVIIIDEPLQETPTTNIYSVRQVIEKPKNTPSNLTITTVYVFNCSITGTLKKRVESSDRGEIELTDTIRLLIDQASAIAIELTNADFIDTGRPGTYIEAKQ